MITRMPFRMRQTITLPYYHVSFIIDALPLFENLIEKKRKCKEIFLSFANFFSNVYVILSIYFQIPIYIVFLRFYFECVNIEKIKSKF